jgi:bacterial/archaeal transporter family-2 protein
VSKELAVLATWAAGGIVALQAPSNSVLADRLGNFGAATVNFFVGTMCLLVVTVLLAGGFKDASEGESVSWFYWVLGGMAGAVYVATTLVTVGKLGAGGVTAALITGQLALSVVIDRVGAFGLGERAVTLEKVLIVRD